MGVPVPVLAATVTFTATFSAEPCLMPVVGESVRVVVVPMVDAVPHVVARLFTLTEPRPVAMSYPAVAVQASVVVWAGSTSTPLPPLAAVLQLSEPPWQGTLLVPTPGLPVGKKLFPLATSLNTQFAASVGLEVQLAPDFLAKAYKTLLALPWRGLPVLDCFWLTRAMTPAKAGAEAEVPPTSSTLAEPELR